MILGAFYVVALFRRDRDWMRNARVADLATFGALAALQGWSMEWVSLELGRWSYTTEMPTILGLGLTPLLQWLLLPALLAWVAKRFS